MLDTATLDPAVQYAHGVLPVPTAEEESRQLFVKSLKYHLATRVAPGNRLAYEARARPAFVRTTGAEPRDHHQIRQLMDGDPYFRMWSALLRTSQEMMWRSVQLSVERQIDDIQDRVTAPEQAPLGQPFTGFVAADPALPHRGGYSLHAGQL